MGAHWKDWCWSWNSNTLAISCEKFTHWKRPWCWEGLGAGGEGDDRGWDDWMASPTRWTCVWVNSGSLWWTGRPGVLRFMGLQRLGHNWATELNWSLPCLHFPCNMSIVSPIFFLCPSCHFCINKLFLYSLFQAYFIYQWKWLSKVLWKLSSP